jgi:hypothetical protein
MSETDAPIRVVCWKDCSAIGTSEQLLEQTHHAAGTPAEEVELEQFFESVVSEQDWFGEEEKETAVRYRSLLSVLKANLSHLNVYRVGEVEIDVSVLGQTEANTVVGIATQIVET